MRLGCAFPVAFQATYWREEWGKYYIHYGERLQYPTRFTQIKQVIKEHTVMLKQLLIYNSGFKLLHLNPYKRRNMLGLINQILNNPRNQQDYGLKKYCDSLQTLSQNLDDNNTVKIILNTLTQIKVKLNKYAINKVFGSEDFVDDLIELQNNIISFQIQDIEKINEIISSFSSCIDLVIAYDSYRNRQNVTSYIKSCIQPNLDKPRESYDGFHIVMESAPLAQIYLLDVLEIIKCFRVEMGTIKENQSNWSNLPITSITISNIHSIAAVIYASDLSVEEMRKYVNKIKSLTYENQMGFINRIQKQLKQGGWAKKLPTLLKDITAFYTKQAQDHNIFAQTQQKLNGLTQWAEFKSRMKNVEGNSQFYKQKLIQLLQQSLNCVMDQIYRTDQNSSINDKLEIIAESLALSYNDVDYGKRDVATPLREFVNILAQKFVELFKIAVQSSQYVAEQLVTSISLGVKKDAWKGLILGEIHTSYKIKNLVQEIMQEVGLAKNTTLQEFYQASSKKITLNFSVITTKNSCIEIYNHYTRPYMPVCAAVVATSSLIQFLKPLTDKKQWRYRLVSNLEQRKIKKYFAQLGPSTYHLYSADSLRRLPVDLLKNDKMAKKVYNDVDIQDKNQRHQAPIQKKNKNKQVFLIFDFNINIDYVKTLKQSQYKNNKNMIKIQNISFKDIVKLLQLNVEAKHVFNIPLINKAIQQVKLYVDSHDKLITNLYRKQLISLPIRLGVVDFHKMCDSVEDNQGKMKNILSKRSNDCIMQSYFVMKQKITNFQTIESKSNQNNKNSKILFFRLETYKNLQQICQNDKLVIRFLSRLVPNKDHRENYKLYYQHNDSFHKINDEYLPLNTRGKFKLRIQYVGIGSLKLCSRDFTLHLDEFKVAGQFGFVYCLKYSIFEDEQGLEPEGYLTGSFQDDYQLSQENKKLNKQDLIIRATLEYQPEKMRYQRPMCDKYHPMYVRKSIEPKTFYDKIQKDRQISKFYCQQCQKQKQKSEYPLNQKYQIKLCESNKIQCTLNHPIEVKSRLNYYPSKFQFVECDKCSKNTPKSYFKDEACGVDLCFDCVFEMIRNQL